MKALRNKYFSYIQNHILFFPFIIYAFCSIFLFNVYRYKLFPDTISYISIAKNYLDGDFYDAINGYFAPLYSWLVVPLLAVGLDELLSIKLLSCLIGFAVFIAIYLFASRLHLDSSVFKLMLYTLIPICIHFTFAIDAPDLLLVLILILYLNQIFSFDFIKNTKRAIFAGILGGFAYLCKHYALPFFLAHYTLMNIFHYYRIRTIQDKSILIRNFLAGMSAFLFISSLWIIIISYKYGDFIISTAARYNYAVMRPNSDGHAVGRVGFLKPSNEKAISAWEDPSILEKESWNPINSLETVKHQLKMSEELTLKILDYFGQFTPLYFAIVIGNLLLLLSIRRRIWDNIALFLVSTLLLYTSGYTLIMVAKRYLWLDCILFLLMGGILLNNLLKLDFFNSRRKKMLFFFFFISFCIDPFVNLFGTRYEGKEIYAISQKLKNKFGIKGNIAAQGKYKNTLYISFFLDSHFFGAMPKDVECRELLHELRTNNIDFYFVFDERKDEFQELVSECNGLLNFKEITNGEIAKLRIYDVRSKP